MRSRYQSNDHQEKENANRRNGYSSKRLKTSYGEVPIQIPRDRDATFLPQVIPKRTTNVADIEDQVLSLCAKGMSQRDIAVMVADIYGFSISHETISEITDRILTELQEWQARPLKRLYAFVFIDCMYVTLRKDYETKKYAVYTMLGYDIHGKKDIPGIWLNETESKHVWMKIFDEIKSCGVEDLLFLSMDGVSGLESGAKAIFKDVIVQRCMVHLIRNSLQYVLHKDYRAFSGQLRQRSRSFQFKSSCGRL